MADDSPAAGSNPPPTSNVPQPPASEDRLQLINRARNFLRSPQIQNQDVSAKRRFLAEKGLNPAEIDELLRELPPQLPLIPPRTYPRPPPSNLPNLLLGVLRFFSWITGGAALFLAVYYRFLLPRIAQSSMVRHALKAHHLSLMRKFSSSLSTFKESQLESFAVLPRLDKVRAEEGQFTACNSVEDALKEAKTQQREVRDVPTVTLLRCTIADLLSVQEDGQQPTTQQIFKHLENKIPWLLSEEGLQHENKLWETLSTNSVFIASTPGSNMDPDPLSPELSCWRYKVPDPPAPSPLVSSLASLSASLPRNAERPRSFQHALQSLSEFTGYISANVYVPYRPPPIPGIASIIPLSPAEDELRREIRALKGLVLNRRSFMASIPRTNSSPPSQTS